MISRPAKPEKRVRLTRKLVAAAAVDCFKRYGVHRTSMNDVADAMGVSRQSVYRIFESRSALLEHIATERVAIHSKKLSKYLQKFDTLKDAIIDGMIYSIDISREDELLTEIIAQDGDAHFRLFLFGGTPEVQSGMLEAWGDLIQKTRVANELSNEFTDAEAVEWICNIGSVLNHREDYDEDARRRILRQFIAPSLIR